MDNQNQVQIIECLNELVVRVAPEAALLDMYGGIVIELQAGDPKSRIGGFYVYAEHVSFEFAKGAAFEDHEGWLEGSGKLRRHLKLRELDDIRSKRCEEFLCQAISG